MAFWLGVTMLAVFAGVLFLAIYIVAGETVWLAVSIFAIALIGTVWIYAAVLLLER